MERELYSNDVLNDFLKYTIQVIQRLWRKGKGGYDERKTEDKTKNVLYFWRETESGKTLDAEVRIDHENNCIEIGLGDSFCTFYDPKKASNYLLRTGLGIHKSTDDYKNAINEYKYKLI